MIEYTPTQFRLMRILEDGNPHTVEELQKCILDDYSEKKTLQSHILILKKKIEGAGKTIVSNKSGRTTYRLALFIGTNY